MRWMQAMKDTKLLKISREVWPLSISIPFIERNAYVKFESYTMNGFEVIGVWQTEGQTDRQTDRQTTEKQYLCAHCLSTAAQKHSSVSPSSFLGLLGGPGRAGRHWLCPPPVYLCSLPIDIYSATALASADGAKTETPFLKKQTSGELGRVLGLVKQKGKDILRRRSL